MQLGKSLYRLLWLVFPLGVAIAAAPYKLSVEKGFSEAAAFAKNDKGGGNDKDGGKGNGSGKDKGDANGNGNGKGGGKGKGDPGGPDQDSGTVDGSTMKVEHPDGIREMIINGLFEMRDAQGRRIILRNATSRDRARLRAQSR